MNEFDATATLALKGAGFIALIGLLIKYVIIDSFKGKSAILTVQAGDNLLDRLQEEITRLEVIIEKQTKRIDELETRISVIHDLEIQDAADIAELTILLDTSCKECPNNNGTVRMSHILERLRERKASSRTRGPVKVVTIGAEERG